MTTRGQYQSDLSFKPAGAKGDGIIDDTVAIQTALDKYEHVILEAGEYRITQTINIPAGVKFELRGSVGNSPTTQSPTRIIKDASLSGPAIQIQQTGWMTGGGVYCDVGNTGDGIQLLSNSARLSNCYIHGAENDGVRVGNALGNNVNSCVVENVKSEYNGRHGIYVHHEFNEAPDTNMTLLLNCQGNYNGGDGIKVGHAQWTNIINGLTQENAGAGLYLSGDTWAYSPSTAECRYTTVIGGDFNEGNGTASVYNAAYSTSIINPDPNQLITDNGVYTNYITNRKSILQELELKYGHLFFPSSQIPYADPYVLDAYEEGTVTLTATGMTTSPAMAADFTLIGNNVTLHLEDLQGISNTTSFTLTGIPTRLRPTSNRTFLVRTINNGGSVAITVAFIDSSGVVNIFNNLTKAAGSWTASGDKRILAQTLSYTL